MRKIDMIVVHCTATKECRDVSAAEIDIWHRQRGFRMAADIPGKSRSIGYHYVIRLDGSVEAGRPEEAAGAHCRGYNSRSIGIVYAGGLDSHGRPKDTRTAAQKAAMLKLIEELLRKYPGASVHGHREFAAKACPCFDARSEYSGFEKAEVKSQSIVEGPKPSGLSGNSMGKGSPGVCALALALAGSLLLGSCRSHKEQSANIDIAKTEISKGAFTRDLDKYSLREVTADSIIIEDLFLRMPGDSLKEKFIKMEHPADNPGLISKRVKIYRPTLTDLNKQKVHTDSTSADSVSEVAQTAEKQISRPASPGLFQRLLPALVVLLTALLLFLRWRKKE